MKRSDIDRLARAVLYEGYVLYPYRPSVKNTRRWTFGGIYPAQWSEMQKGGDAAMFQAECLIDCGNVANCQLQITLRFLHLVDRAVGKLVQAVDEALFAGGDPGSWKYEWVERLEVGAQQYQAWQEARECEIDVGEMPLTALLERPLQKPMALNSTCIWEPLISDGDVVGVLRRQSRALDAGIEVSAQRLGDVVKVRLVVRNTTPMADAAELTRDQASLRSLASAHAVLSVTGGKFVSLTDPPMQWAAQAAGCGNVGVWPVLVGEEGRRDTLFAAPIILPDYPQLAPESPGDLFDGTEIDEILTLRIMTLTDQEKREAAGMDERVKALLARTESLARDELMNLHGTVRGLQPVAEHAHD